MCTIRMWSIIDDQAIDKHGDSPIFAPNTFSQLVGNFLLNISKTNITNALSIRGKLQCQTTFLAILFFKLEKYN